MDVDSKLEEHDDLTERYFKLYALSWQADVEACEESRRQRDEFCERDEAMGREFARMERTKWRLRAAAGRSRRRTGLAPVVSPRPPAGRERRPATNGRTRGSKRTTGSGSSSSGEDDPPSSEPGEPARRCSQCNEDISSLRSDATVCRRSKCRRAAQRSCERGHTHVLGACRRCGKYCLPSGDKGPDRAPEVARRRNPPRAPRGDDTAAQWPEGGQGSGPRAHELWPGMGSRAPATTAPDLRLEVMRAAVRKGLKVELTRDPAGGIVVRIVSSEERAS
jgi:hypothetical protein